MEDKRATKHGCTDSAKIKKKTVCRSRDGLKRPSARSCGAKRQTETWM